MNFKDELHGNIVEAFGRWKRSMDAYDSDAGARTIRETEEVIMQLFLDTIEKAKPEKRSAYVSPPLIDGVDIIDDLGIIYNRAVNEFESNLKKEINHE